MAKDASGSGEGRLYDDDLYSDFDVVGGHELKDDLERTPALAEAVRTSQLGRRVPSITSTAPRLQAAPSTRRSTDLIVSRSRLLGVFDPETPSAAPPLTAIQRAGYSSAGGHVCIGWTRFSTDRTNGRAYLTMCRPSLCRLSVVCNVLYCG